MNMILHYVHCFAGFEKIEETKFELKNAQEVVVLEDSIFKLHHK